MRQLRTLLVLGTLATVVFAGPVSAASAGKYTSDGTTTAAPTVDTAYALVQLNGDPLSTYVKTKPAPGKKIDFNNSTSKSYRAQLSALRNDFKQWLQANAPKARITGSWDISLNAVGVKLNGTSLETLKKAPQVKRAEYQGLYRPTTEDIDLNLVDAPEAWALVGGAAHAGEGVKVGIIDTGIDVNHDCFDDTGYPAHSQLGNHNYTNNKVIVARVFNNKGNQNGFGAEAIQDHGSHVAGTVACNYQTPATVDGAAIAYDPSGVAPRALLGSYNVFPGDVEDARSEDILNALDAAYADGMDVVNMSLGGNAHGVQDLLTIAVDDLDLANMVVAMSAGNSGDGDADAHPPLAAGHYTVGSPGSAARGLTAGASSVGHNVISGILVGSTLYATDRGEFAYPTTDLTAATMEAPTGPAVALVDNHKDGCLPYTAGAATGKIVLVARGNCDFSVKVNNAQLAGAVGVVIVNRDPAPIPMADNPDLHNTIPAVMVGKADGLALYANVPNPITITAPFYVSQLDPATDQWAPESNVQADFSSQGPTDVDYRVKPDLMAPGVNVLSSVVGNKWAFFQGTSMASPHLAGAAAVVRGAHPDWSAEQVRSAIVNSAKQGQVTSFVDGSVVTDVNITGAGLLDVDAAVSAVVALGPVSTSFGAVPSGSGSTKTASVMVTNLTGSPNVFSLSVNGTTGSGVSFTLSTSSVNLGAGASTTVTVTMTAAKTASAGDHQAMLRVASGGHEVAHSALYVFMK